jgi:hypothetical protein
VVSSKQKPHPSIFASHHPPHFNPIQSKCFPTGGKHGKRRQDNAIRPICPIKAGEGQEEKNREEKENDKHLPSMPQAKRPVVSKVKENMYPRVKKDDDEK